MNERAPKAERAGESSSGMLLAIALFKLVKAVLLIALGFAALSLARDAQLLTKLRHVAAFPGFGSHAQLADRAISAISGIDHRRLHELSVGTFIYAAVFLVEGTGLLLRKPWAEYLTAIVTASFIPFEVYEMSQAPSAAKGIGIAVNAAIVAYLVIRLWQRRHDEQGKKGVHPKAALDAAHRA